MKNTAKKKSYAKPTIKAEGNIEEITLKGFGPGDAYMLSGMGAGSENAS